METVKVDTDTMLFLVSYNKKVWNAFTVQSFFSVNIKEMAIWSSRTCYCYDNGGKNMSRKTNYQNYRN